MINQVKIFLGSKNDFNYFLEKENVRELGHGNYFVEFIQHYNSRIKPSEAGVKEIRYNYCICRQMIFHLFYHMFYKIL